MSNYIDSDFNPVPEFWSALYESNICAKCGYTLNGYFMIRELLAAPVEAKCTKCHAEWSTAIPLGKCEERSRIENLLAAEGRFYRLRDELRNTINLLHGREDNG